MELIEGINVYLSFFFVCGDFEWIMWRGLRGALLDGSEARNDELLFEKLSTEECVCYKVRLLQCHDVKLGPPATKELHMETTKEC